MLLCDQRFLSPLRSTLPVRSQFSNKAARAAACDNKAVVLYTVHEVGLGFVHEVGLGFVHEVGLGIVFSAADMVRIVNQGCALSYINVPDIR